MNATQITSATKAVSLTNAQGDLVVLAPKPEGVLILVNGEIQHRGLTLGCAQSTIDDLLGKGWKVAKGLPWDRG